LTNATFLFKQGSLSGSWLAAMTISKIGTTHYTRYLSGKKTFQIDVQQMVGKVAAHFVTSMQVDADGAPKAYHDAEGGKPGDLTEYQNNWPCFDWLDNLSESDRCGTQGVGGALGPAPGFVVSATSLKDQRFAENDTRRYVDASTIPYIVLPGSFLLPAGMPAGTTAIKDCLGCLAYMIDLTSGHSTGAVFADVGPACGEASLCTALRLGRKPYYAKFYPKVCGIDSKRFVTIVFPAEILTMPLAADDVHNRAQALFYDWGDWTGLAQALKQVPKETPTDAPDDDIATLQLPPPKGPVAQNLLVAMDQVRPPSPRLTAGSDVVMIDAPPDGNSVATLSTGTEVELIETLPHGAWLRVFATIEGVVRQGYVRAAPFQK